MRRKVFTFSLILAFAALVLAGAAGAQQSGRVSRIGWLSPNSGSAGPKEFLHAMRAHGYIEGQNLAIEERFTQGNADRYPALAAELVALKPDCIVALGVGATRAAKQATTTIPIIMGNADDDPVRARLVASYAHPGGNVTGYTNIGSDLAGKRLELLRDLISGLSRVAILWQPNINTSTAYVEETESAAATIGVKIKRLPVRAARELAGAFREAVASGAQAIIVPAVDLMNSHQRTIVDLAIAGHLPLMTNNTPFADAGALISYDADRRERFQQVAGYVSRILKGANPADLPVLRPTKFELVVNLKTAKALGLTVPQSLLARADEVIE
jgi:putative tryptophan/tyrosine transport system substrate-binding protein